MIEFVINYWMVVLPTALTGVVLLNTLRKRRDEQAKKEKSLVPVPIRRKQQG